MRVQGMSNRVYGLFVGRPHHCRSRSETEPIECEASRDRILGLQEFLEGRQAFCPHWPCANASPHPPQRSRQLVFWRSPLAATNEAYEQQSYDSCFQHANSCWMESVVRTISPCSSNVPPSSVRIGRKPLFRSSASALSSLGPGHRRNPGRLRLPSRSPYGLGKGKLIASAIP